MGRRHRPFYRLAAVDQRGPRDGRVIEELGVYDPINKDPQQQIKVLEDRIRYWLSVGAQPSETVHSILRRSGMLDGAFLDVPAARKK